MAQKGSIFSLLRGRGKPAPVGQPRSAPSQDPALPDAPQTAPEPPKRPPVELRPDPEHPLSRLWALCGGLPAPRLSLEPLLSLDEEEAAPPDPNPSARASEREPLLSLEEAVEDLERLEQEVTQAAERRLAELLGRQEALRREAEQSSPDGAHDGQEPPPPDMDADVQLFRTARDMSAWLLVYPPSGKGLPLDKRQLHRALDEAGVRHGLDKKLLDHLPKMDDCCLTLHLIARGTPPVHGRDGCVIDLFPREPVHHLKEDENGRVDFASVEIFQSAKEGDMICRILQPTESCDGRTVLGELLPGRKGKPADPPQGRNTRLSRDGSRLLADCTGHVDFCGTVFEVKPVLEVHSNVDYSTGHIKSLGDVHIFGDVRGGFSVKAGGSVTVDGVVEASTVEAGGDILIRKGVQGSGQGLIRAQRCVFAKYIERCTILARENLETEGLIHCKVYCNKDITVRSGRGSLVGGEVCAGQKISANIVGTRAEVPTAISLGGHPFEDAEQASLTRDIAILEKELEKLERQPESPKKLQQMSRTRVHISANQKKLRQYDRDLAKAARKETEEQKKAVGRMECNMLYPGVDITIGAYSLRVDHETHSCVTSISNGEIKLI